MTQKLAIREIFHLDFFSALHFARIHRLSFLSLCKLLNVIKKYKIISLPSWQKKKRFKTFTWKKRLLIQLINSLHWKKMITKHKNQHTSLFAKENSEWGVISPPLTSGHCQLSSKSLSLLGLLKTSKTLYTHSSPSNFVLWHVNFPQWMKRVFQIPLTQENSAAMGVFEWFNLPICLKIAGVTPLHRFLNPSSSTGVYINKKHKKKQAKAFNYDGT